MCVNVHHYIAFSFFFLFSSRGVTARLLVSWPNLKPFFYLVRFDQGRTLVLLAFLDRDIYDNSSRTNRNDSSSSSFLPSRERKRITSHFFLFFSPTHSISPLHPTTSLPIIPIIITTTTFLLPPLPNIPIIHSCSSDFHCLFSQKNPISTLSPRSKKKQKISLGIV